MGWNTPWLARLILRMATAAGNPFSTKNDGCSAMMYTGRDRELRLVVTTRCNFACIFCHMEGVEEDPCGGTGELSAEDWVWLVRTTRAFCGAGFRITITGGEPLLRADIEDIAGPLQARRGTHVTLVTNGSLLRPTRCASLSRVVDRFNVSLHAADGDRYAALTRCPGGSAVLDSVKDSARALRDTHGKHVRVNAVIGGEGSQEGDLGALVGMAEKVATSLKLLQVHAPPGSMAREWESAYAAGKEGSRAVRRKLERVGYVRRRCRRRPGQSPPPHTIGPGETMRCTEYFAGALPGGVGLSSSMCNRVTHQPIRARICHLQGALFVTPTGVLQRCMEDPSQSEAIGPAIRARDTLSVVLAVERQFFQMGVKCRGDGSRGHQ